ncbi:hypothetical protein [Actinomyces vulturis]|uniref:hypothetical protein n=1 Tax=Actinomyces vulturis TaxID=1857645 RepID=UPI00082A49B9|nr:hypothetical protein [Actinomyces vulturis]
MILQILGANIAVDLSDLPDSLAAPVREAWRHCTVDNFDHLDREIRVITHPDDKHSDDDLVVGETKEDITYRVSQHLTRLLIAWHAGRSLMFHAAGLTSPDSGKVIGVIAPSGTGKTTFCEMLTHEFGYVTDETLVIARSGEVFPYQKPLSIIRRSIVASKQDYSPLDLGLTLPNAEKLSLGALVLAERSPKVGSEELIPMTLAEAMEDVIGQTSSLFKLENPLDFLASVLVQAGGPWKLRFHDQSKCADLLKQLAHQNDVGVSYRHIPGTLDGTATLNPHNYGPIAEHDRFVRAPWTDAIESEGHVIILVGHQPLILGGAGAAVWLACEHAATITELHAQVVSTLGEHPGSWRLVEEAMGTLVSQGVLIEVRNLNEC